MPEESVGDHGHQGVAMKASPRPPLEVVEAEFFLELLVRLLANPGATTGQTPSALTQTEGSQQGRPVLRH
jgi:hypothetical protein